MKATVVLVDQRLSVTQLAGGLAGAGLSLRFDTALRHLVIGPASSPAQPRELRRLLNQLAVTARTAHAKTP